MKVRMLYTSRAGNSNERIILPISLAFRRNQKGDAREGEWMLSAYDCILNKVVHLSCEGIGSWEDLPTEHYPLDPIEQQAMRGWNPNIFAGTEPPPGFQRAKHGGVSQSGETQRPQPPGTALHDNNASRGKRRPAEEDYDNPPPIPGD